jgi:hypothetical protein
MGKNADLLALELSNGHATCRAHPVLVDVLGGINRRLGRIETLLVAAVCLGAGSLFRQEIVGMLVGLLK